MKRSLAFILAIVLLSFTACDSKEESGNKIPDIFGIDYQNATTVLEAEGFEVTTIGTDVAPIASKLLYPLEFVGQGTVFKVDDYILDNNGNLTKNYDVFYDGEFISDDKNIVIYYANADFVLEKENQQDNSIETQGAISDETAPLTTEAIPEDTKKAESIGADFKAAMDSYEEFMDKYVAFIKKYNNNPSDLSLLTDYANYMTDYADFVEEFAKWENEDLNSVELAYYLDVQTRVNKKLLDIVS